MGAKATEVPDASDNGSDNASSSSLMLQEDTETASVQSKKGRKKKKSAGDEQQRPATIKETLSFVLGAGANAKILFFFGCVGGFGNGMVLPFVAWIFSDALSDLSGTAANGLDDIKEIAFWFMGIGTYALLVATLQTTCFEVVAFQGAQNLQLQWFHSLLRQDSAFFDVHDISGIATSIKPASVKYRRGVGRKFGEGIQFFTTGVGGIAYALYAEWRVALVVLSFCPVVAFFATGLVTINQGKSARAAEAYSKAGSVAYSTVSGIKTVLSLNAGTVMIQQYKDATEAAFQVATKPLIKQGFTAGMMLGSFLLMYVILTLYGTFNIYRDVFESGCDPSGAVPNNDTCRSSGAAVFGAMFGIAFAAQGISAVGSFLEIFTAARVAAGQAITAIKRKPGRPEQKIYHIEEDKAKTKNDENGDGNAKDNESVASSSRSSANFMIESPEGRIKAILPAYVIDSMSTEGLKPTTVKGRLTFENVGFSYPTRPGDTVLDGLSIDIPAGKTIAFVGPSGGGKSTVVKLLERFYDPLEGSVMLDGTDIKELNVKHLRSMIGYVGQEPALFSTTIGENISHGCLNCSQEQIEEAAKQANAHDFITQLPDGYDTQVGDRGSQLSGGQKQRIAIARVLIGDPKILLLDEATSALDTQSELVVQEALEKIISTRSRTTVIIAHRLSTIRNADTIAVVMGGTIVETGTHDELMESKSYYKKLVDAQGKATSMERNSSTFNMQRGSSESQHGFEAVPDRFVDMNAAPLIVFRNLSFSYPTRPNKTILDRFKLKIYKGETVGLCGISGGGKSTVMGLIERFYDPDEGTVEYFGEDIKNINVKWYRDQIGYVGQEPTLFDATIAENIAFGAPGATREEIEEAAKQANAYDFIMSFPEDFDTPLIGGAGTQLSGGQKQRIAIARALVKKPEILLLDEATSALDNESERIVQEALDKLMESNERTCIVIAHRLSTIRNADRIAFIGDGCVKEIGSHEELMKKPKGRYKRLIESQSRGASTVLHGIEKSKKKKGKKGEDEKDSEESAEDFEKQIEEEEASKFEIARARQLASPDGIYLLIGSLGALMAGSIFPSWGLLFAETIDLLFSPVFSCDPENLDALLFTMNYETCEAYWNSEGERLKERSFVLSAYWIIIVFVCITGNILVFWGFGHASERMTRRLRDDAFHALVRQEVSFYDKRSVGKITSELQEDATRIQTFTGEPVRSLLIALSSLLTGVVLSFYFMWEFALLAIVCVPIMGFATSLEMKQLMGEDEGVDNTKEEVASPGGIIVETLLNMGTISALTMEEERYRLYQEVTENSDSHYVRAGLTEGVLAGLSLFVQQWVNAMQLYFGGWLLFKYPEKYAMNDFLISNFALMFSLFGLGAAFQDMSNRKETELSASRVFYLLDRESSIDPLSEEGIIVDTTTDKRSSLRKKKSVRKKGRASLKKVVEKSEDDTVKQGDSKEIKAGVSSDDEIPKSKPSTPKKTSLEKNKKPSLRKQKSKKAPSKKSLTEATDVEGQGKTATTELSSSEPKKLEKKKSVKKLAVDEGQEKTTATNEQSTSKPKTLKKKKSTRKKTDKSKPTAQDIAASTTEDV